MTLFNSVVRSGLVPLLWLFLLAGAQADGVAARHPALREFFPEATRFAEPEGEPPAAAVYRHRELIGYAFFTFDVLRISAYSGKPINTLVGLDLGGRLRGIRIVEHEEPVLVIGITDARLRQFTDQYRGKSAFDRVAVGAERAGYVTVDAISGATITVMVENSTVMRSARAVAESRGLSPPTAAAPAAPIVLQRVPPPATRATPARSVPAVLAPPEEPIWTTVWQRKTFQIAVLAAGLLVLTAILLFQDWLVRRPRLLGYVRRIFLLYTIVFIGWYAFAQLTIVNVLTFTHAIVRDFRWESFLIDPMMFILWSFVAAALLLWGRGVYCGWLCPFGALQELVQQIAQRLKLPQLEFPDAVHERLWALKYVLLLLLFGVSLQSLTQAERYAEIEPFKSVFTLRLQREWPFVAYAVGLLAVSAFNRKFFCKYLCPLGAALTIPGRFRVFDWWLRRRKECGHPCQTCASECEVRSIRPTGEINANECHYCLDCQVTYYNDHKCPPLIERREGRRRGRRTIAMVPIQAPPAGH